MMRIEYTEQQHYDFACQFLQAAPLELRVQVDAQHLAITVSDATVGYLLQRICENRSVILPDFTSHRWLITGKTYQQVEQARIRLQHFLVPTYAQFADKQSPQLHMFDASKRHRIQQLGAVLYPYGYYVLESKKEFFTQILNRLALWIQLESERPPIKRQARTTYSTLYERFKAALAAGQWQIAEDSRRQMQVLNLTSADNLLFLEIEQFAQQERWLEIGKHKDFELLARMHVPRAVRGALLTAFHATSLLAYEQQGQWQQALEHFREELPRLGYLLTSRLGLTQGPVVQVHAYQAVVEHDWATLKALAEVNKSQETLECITQLLLILGPEKQEAVTVVHDSAYLARAALHNWDYDTALRYSRQIEDQVEQTFLLVLIAFHTDDAQLAEEALYAFWACSDEEQQRLQARSSFVNKALNRLLQLTDARATPVEDDVTQPELSITTWLEWFAYAQTNPDAPILLSALGQLVKTTDERSWTNDSIMQLSDCLLTILDNRDVMKHSTVGEAWKRLVSFFLDESAFPRQEEQYDLLYETLYNGLLESRAKDSPEIIGFLLLRLAEALLKHTPDKCSSICKNLEQWCESPLPILENWILEAFELLAEYGLTPSLLIPWYRTWLPYLLNLPSKRNRINLELWLKFGKWIHPGDDLIKHLETVLAQVSSNEQEEVSPLSLLPANYRIGIFCLRSSSAERARDVLLEHNPQIDVRICTDQVLTKPAQSLAEHSDLAVLVTTCMTHALSYGISPSLKHALIYPQSSGSTSIVHAIEDYARKTFF